MTLDELAADLMRARDLPLAEAVAMLARVGGLEAVLRARVAAGEANGRELEPTQATPADRLLTADEAAAMLGVTVRWLRERRDLPFRRQLSPHCVRYSRTGIERYRRSSRFA